MSPAWSLVPRLSLTPCPSPEGRLTSEPEPVRTLPSDSPIPRGHRDAEMGACWTPNLCQTAGSFSFPKDHRDAEMGACWTPNLCQTAGTFPSQGLMGPFSWQRRYKLNSCNKPWKRNLILNGCFSPLGCTDPQMLL